MTVSTFYAESSDGRIRSENDVYATAISGSNLSVDTSASQLYCGQIYDTGDPNDYSLDVLAFAFDASSIPDTDTISAAVLSLYIDGADTPRAWTIQARLYDWGGTLTTADWCTAATLSSATLLASVAAGSVSSGAYTDLTSEAAFIANVSKTGTTYIVVCSSQQVASSAPSDYERAYVSMSERGTVYRPKLVVTHAPSGSDLSALLACGFGIA